MADHEREGGYEPPLDRADGAHESTEPTDDERAAAREMRLESAERNVTAEASTEKRDTKERLADLLWERPKHFVERVVAKKIGPYFKRFLGKFSELDDDAAATDALKRTRDAAKDAAQDGK